jgi:hypothetical protein
VSCPDRPAAEATARTQRVRSTSPDRSREDGIHQQPRWPMESKSRCPALVKLRSAEADPHVTKRASGRPANRLTMLPPHSTPPPEGVGLACPWARPCSTSGRMAPPAEAGGLVPVPHPSIWSLQHRPLPGATVNSARVEQLTSGLCSADESVAAHRRFQRCAARFSHGLGSPSRSPSLRVRPDWPRTDVLSAPGSRFPAGEPVGPRHRPLHRGESRCIEPRHPSASSSRCRVLPPKW